MFKITCGIQGFATVAEYSGLMECGTAIGLVVPNISQALHSFNIFEVTHTVASDHIPEDFLTQFLSFRM